MAPVTSTMMTRKTTQLHKTHSIINILLILQMPLLMSTNQLLILLNLLIKNLCKTMNLLKLKRHNLKLNMQMIVWRWKSMARMKSSKKRRKMTNQLGSPSFPIQKDGKISIYRIR